MSVEFHCPSCGKKLFDYEVRMRKYGRLIETCKYCRKEYIDPRRVELAISGIPQDEYKLTSYVLVMVVCVLLILRGRYLLGVHQLGTPEQVQWLLPTLFIGIGIVGVILSIFEMIFIKTGGKKKKMQRLLDESKARMQNYAYVEKLKDFGIELPEGMER